MIVYEIVDIHGNVERYEDRGSFVDFMDRIADKLLVGEATDPIPIGTSVEIRRVA